MNKTSFGFKNAIRLLFGCVLLFLAVLFGMAGAFFGFVLCAVFLSHVVILSLIALLFCFLISYGLSRIAWRKILRESHARLALGVGLVTAIGVLLISFLTIFKPLVPSSEIIVPRVPEAVDYWDLETGSRIAYLKFPAENKTKEEPVIFLHGGPGGAVVSFPPITDVISALSKDGYDVYFYDQVGGGLSGRLRNIREYQLSRHVLDLDQIRKKINAEKIILVGESHGGRLAAHYAAAYPENVERLVLISPGDLISQEWDDESSGSIKDKASLETLQKFDDSLKTPRIMFTILLFEMNPDAAHNFLSEAEADTLVTELFSLLMGGMACDPERFPKNHNILFGFWATMIPDELPEPPNEAAKDKLRSLAHPVLILKAECDYLKWEVTYEYKSLLQNSTLLFLEGAGHMPFLEKPGLVLDSVRSFLLDKPLPLPAYTGRSQPKK
ncbi:MAG: alpha/beta fold hydrolase [Candidatus Aminicenantes bacterium]|jgi:proline iminopeptidase